MIFHRALLKFVLLMNIEIIGQLGHGKEIMTLSSPKKLQNLMKIRKIKSSEKGCVAVYESKLN